MDEEEIAINEENEGKPPLEGTSTESNPIRPSKKQKLFLLEFIVDDINLDFCNSKQLACFGTGKTVVEFKFLDFGPLRISEDDFTPIQKRYLEGCTGTGNIKNGKSIIFGLTQEQTKEVGMKSIIFCDFFKKTEKREYKIGSCIIALINMFKELVESVQKGGQPQYRKHYKNVYKIKDNGNETVGHMYAYIRLSCFNELITNKVKKDPNEELDYTPEKGVYNYKYNRSKGNLQEESNICECKENKGKSKVCECPDECPHKTCPQIYTDNKCIFDCPQTLRPCQACPPTCAANRQAGKVRVNQQSFLESSKSRASKKSEKSGKSGGKNKKNGKKRK